MASNEMDYKRYFYLIKRDKKLCIIVALVIMTLVTAGSYVIPNKYEAQSTVFVEKSVLSELLKGLTFTPSTEDKIKVLTYALNSRTLIAKVVDELDMKKGGDAELEVIIKNLQEHTQIKIKDKEGLFVISFQDDNPKLARDYVNALVRRYIDENTSSKREESYGATKFLTEQLTTFRDKLQKTEDEVNDFKRGQGAISTMDTSTLLKDINDSQQRADDLKIKEAQIETTMTGLGRGYSAQSNLPALQKRLQELQLQYTDSYPEIIRLKDEMRGMEAQMKNAKPTVVRPSESPEYDRLNSELRAIRQAEANLRTNIARNRSLLQNIPAAKAQLDNLEREKQSQKTLYESMLGRQGQSEVSKQMEVQDKSTVFRVVDPAVLPIKPVSPDRKKLILLGILAGIGGGLGLVILKDQMDNTIKSVDMARLIGLPLLAVIPHIDDPEQLAQQTRQDRKLYAAGVLYFLVILTVLVMEVFGFAIISDLMREIIGLIR